MSEKTSRFGAWRWIPIDRLSGGCLIVAGLLILWIGRDYPLGHLASPGPGFVPAILATGLIISGVLIAALGAGSEPLGTLTWTGTRRAVAIIAICSFGAFALERLGYRITIFVAMMAFLAVLERRPLLNALAMAAVFSFGSYFLFHNLLDVQLPLSPWGF